MGFLNNLPLYKKSDLRYLCEVIIPITNLDTFHYGSIFCPFHHNVNTPAATLFKDPDGVERIYCYACKKQFTSYDYITQVLEKEPIDFLIKKYTKEDLDEFLKNRIDVRAKELEKLKFTNVETLLVELYNFDKSLSPNQT